MQPTTTTAVPLPTGPVPTAGFDGTTFTLGVLSTTTHPVWGQIGKALSAGIESHFAAVNRRGGIAGKYPVRLLVEDNQYDPAVTASKFNATKDGVAAYVSILGTPNVQAVLPLLDQFGIVASPASQDAEWSVHPNLLPVFNTYQVQAINGIAYFLSTPASAGATVCAASVQTAFGDTGTEGFRFAAERLSFKAGPVVTIAAEDNAPAAAIGQLRAAGCQAVLVTAGPRQAAALAVGSAQSGYRPRWIVIGASFSDRLVTQQTSALLEQTMWVVGDGTGWGDPSIPGSGVLIQSLLDADHRFWTENPDVGLSFGYAQARVLEVLLERAVNNNDVSRTGLRLAAAQLGVVDFGGLGSRVDYSANPRLSVPMSTIFTVDGSARNAIRVIARDFSSPAANQYRLRP